MSLAYYEANIGAENSKSGNAAQAEAEGRFSMTVAGDIDLRCLDQVAFHETHQPQPDIQYSGSQKVELGFTPRMCVHCAKSVEDCECRTFRHQP
jgi:hypothetical protein